VAFNSDGGNLLAGIAMGKTKRGRPPPERWRKLAAEKVAQVNAFVVQARKIRKMLSETLEFRCPRLVERGRDLPATTARPALRLKRTARS
jgi:hypothetical protein